jgi:hypothetical protein
VAVDHRASSAGRAGGTIFWIVVVLVVPLLVAVATRRAVDIRQHQLLPMALQFAVVAYTGSRLTRLFVAAQRNYLQVVFWFFSYVWMGVAAFVQVTQDQYPLPISFDDQVVATTALIVLAGLVAYDAGCAVSRRSRDRAGTVAFWLSNREINDRRAMLISVAVLVATPILVQRLGGLGVQFTSREAESAALMRAGLLSDDSKAAAGIYVALATIPSFLAFYCLCLIRQGRRSLGKPMTIGLAMMLLLLLVVNIIFNNPNSNPRFWFGSIAISLVLLGRFGGRPSGIRLLIAGLVLCGIVVFPYADYFRYTHRHYQSPGGIGDTLATKGDYDAIQMTQASVDYSERVGHTNGRQAMGALLFWYPRSWWPSKPRDTGVMLATYYDTYNKNVSSPLWGELFLDFGLPGVLVGFLLLGWASGSADRFLTEVMEGTGSRNLLRVAVPIMAGYQVIIIRGSLLQSFGRASVIILVVLLITSNRRHHEPEIDDGPDSTRRVEMIGGGRRPDAGN